MKLVVLTAEGPQHAFVTAALAKAFEPELAAIIVSQPPPRSTKAMLRSYLRRYSVPQLASRITARIADRLSKRSTVRADLIARTLYPGGNWQMPRPDLIKRFPTHNHADCLAYLDSIKPDYIAVYGTGVIREPVIQRAGKAILNLHTGISPRYRGSDSVFWALHNGEPEWIGSTVHTLDARLDAGSIYGTRKVTLAPDDVEGTLFAKCVMVGSALYVEVLRSLAAGSIAPTPQNLAEGQEYRFVDRTVGAERRVERAVRGGLLRRAVGG